MTCLYTAGNNCLQAKYLYFGEHRRAKPSCVCVCVMEHEHRNRVDCRDKSLVTASSAARHDAVAGSH